MKIPLPALLIFWAASLGWAQPFGLTNRVANTTLRMPLASTPGINYRIPPDNPFVGATNFNGSAIDPNNVRTEFYAVGLRNPWRYSFDPVSGLLWLADVGQNAREEIDIIVKGGNYGWAYREGTMAGPKSPPPGFTSIDPIYDYGRTLGNSVTGGFVYRGSRFPELYGAYIFGDYGSGRIWQMRYDTNTGTATVPVQIGSEGNISCFGPDPSNGDVLIGNVLGNYIRRLVSSGSGYTIDYAFGATLFPQPVAIVSAPGDTNRLFIVEQAGRIAVITNLASPNRTIFMDISSRVRFSGEQGLLGLAFHPGYLTNRYFYAFYVSNTNGNQTADNSTRHEILSRFEISPTDPNVGQPNSELMMLRQMDEASNHNAGDLHFGPDGYLYVTLGDEGNADDFFNNSQTITKDFFSAMMRLDVDFRPNSLMPNPHPANTIGPSAIIPPATLADTGIFSDTAARRPNPGIIPYDVNAPYWADGAINTRWFSVPLGSSIVFRGTQSWTFPVGTVWIQHFDLELTNGIPGSRRPIETRVLVRDTSTTPGHYGVSYRWNASGNAVLVAPEGEQQTFTIYESGVAHDQTWRYPSRADCLVCHNLTSGRALGFGTAQVNRDFNYADYTGVVDNQLRAFANVGYFSIAVSNINTLPLLARIDDTSFGVQFRARSYLMANCVHCHYPGTTNGNFNARIYQTLATQNILDGILRNLGSDPNNRAIRRGSLTNSMIHTRMASTAAGTRMPPPLDAQIVDQQAVNVFRDWILELANYQTFAEWQVANFGSSNAPNAAATADPDADGARNQLEYYTGTNPNDPLDSWKIGIQLGQPEVSLVYTQTPNVGFEVQWTTNILNTNSWRLLNTAPNRPNFSGQTQLRAVPDPIEPVQMKNYRVRVFEQ